MAPGVQNYGSGPGPDSFGAKPHADASPRSKAVARPGSVRRTQHGSKQNHRDEIPRRRGRWRHAGRLVEADQVKVTDDAGDNRSEGPNRYF
jgi:hypothetical protein